MIRVIVTALMCLFLAPAWATQYWVDNSHANASDSGPGTWGQPWVTIQKAADTMVAGDNVVIRKGNGYEELVTPANSGTAGNLITYWTTGGEKQQVSLTGGFRLVGKSYIKIARLWIHHTPGGGAQKGRGISVNGPSTGVVISGNLIEDTHSSGIAIWGCDFTDECPEDYIDGILVTTNILHRTVAGSIIDGEFVVGRNEQITVKHHVRDADIRNNLVLGSAADTSGGGEGIDIGYGVRDSIVRENEVGLIFERKGIYVESADSYSENIIVERNYVHDITGSSGISVTMEGNGTMDGVIVRNNGMVRIDTYGFLLFTHPKNTTGEGIHNVQIVNNTIAYGGQDPNHTGACIRTDYPNSTGVVVSNNISAFCDTAYANRLDTATIDENNFVGDPDFVPETDPHPWSLNPGSMAINYGSATYAPYRDFLMQVRPCNGVDDAGAYENDC